MRGQIKEILTGLSKATLIVTHDQLEALTMADRIAVMRDGAIEQIASPHEIFTQPKNLFVAGFIGTPQMNLLEAKLVGFEAGRGSFALAEQVVDLEVDAAVAALATGSPVTIGIRPRAFEVTSEPGPDSLTGQVDIIEPMGGETLVHLLTSGLDIRVVVPRELSLVPGERLHLRCRPGQAQVFDNNGERVIS
jgi:ABC-type sugar transport system ATPase subunit